MAGRNDDKFRCSFCGKTQDQVRKLIAGPNGAYICDECVDICAEIIDEELENDEAAGEVAEPEEQINLLKPEELKAFLDDYVIGQDQAPLCQQAMDLNFDGLIVESHCNPDCAWSDASQQVTPDVLDYILNLLVIRTETQSTESLAQLRKQIDECDDNIIQELSKRMRVAREIGTYKKEHGITVLQAGRYNEILEKRGAQGEQCGMDSEFMKKIFEAIHEESVRQQMEIINK